ncbi:MAG TPA: SH3 domain-containing protein [Candidatus Sabulitectum sp.]|nr:SH3 domain-containing protein [Candidatus Sabulitectum sp.]
MPSQLLAAVLFSLAFVSADSIRAYVRPSTLAPVFCYIAPGDTLEVTVRTRDGWLGFDPGIAQAGNTGSFRYRWIPPGAAGADTTGIPVVWGPEAATNYVMILDDTPVRAEPEYGSTISAILHHGEAAEVVGTSGEWYRIAGVDGTDSWGTTGWITLESASLSEM